MLNVYRETRLVIVAGIGLAAGLIEEGAFKDNVSIPVGCNAGG